MFDFFDPLLLARVQFAYTISAHIVFPAFSIGLASYLAVLEGLWLLTRDEAYLKVFNYWKIIFAVTFGMGVVSGIVMSYQLGTNWSVFSDKTGPVLGPLMGYEVLSAFFLEAGFLGVMLYGFDKVGHRLHFFSTLMVAIGTLFSAFWILSVNSWMHTPQGYAINDVGQFIPADWWAVVFNPSFPYRLVHMVLAAYLTTAFVVGGVGAWHLLKDSRDLGARIMFSMAMWMAVLVAPLQIVVGDFHGLNTLEHQPAKVAAMEGHYETRRGAPLILFGIPDDDAEVTRYAVEIPKLGSLILTHDPDGEVKGLKALAERGSPAGRHCFLELPHHGGTRPGDGSGRSLGRLAAVPGPAVRQPPAVLCRRADDAVRLFCGPRRLGHHRGRAPAVDGLWIAQDRRQRLTDRGGGGRGIIAGLHRRLLHGLRRRGFLYPAADVEAPGRRDRDRHRAKPRRRDHAVRVNQKKGRRNGTGRPEP